MVFVPPPAAAKKKRKRKSRKSTGKGQTTAASDGQTKGK